MNAKKIILDLCGGSGSWSKAYEEAYDVRVLTLPDNDVRTYVPPANVHGILAAPPCNEFSFVKSEKLTRDIAGALEVYHGCMRIIDACKKQGGLAWWALENPIGHLVTYAGRPQFTFQPWEFGDPWTKRTGIWGEFTAPERKFTSWADVPKLPLYVRPGRGKPNMVWLHKSAQATIPAFRQFAPAINDAAFRAITPQGFARAFFDVNP